MGTNITFVQILFEKNDFIQKKTKKWKKNENFIRKKKHVFQLKDRKTKTKTCFLLVPGTDDEDQEYDCLGAWGPRFDKLSTMYGQRTDIGATIPELDEL